MNTKSEATNEQHSSRNLKPHSRQRLQSFTETSQQKIKKKQVALPKPLSRRTRKIRSQMQQPLRITLHRTSEF
jgi:hypothetical protein